MASKFKMLSHSLKSHAIKSLQFNNGVTTKNCSNSKEKRDELYDDQGLDFSHPDNEMSFNESRMIISTPIKSTNNSSRPLPQEQTFHTNNISMRSILNDTTYHTNDVTMCEDDDASKNNE